MRTLAGLLALIALLVAGCGGGSKQSHSVLDVSKAFYDAGIPFSGVVTGNPYVTGQTPYLPLALNSSPLRYDVLAELSGSSTTNHTGDLAFVFDTDKHVDEALAAVPLPRWGTGAGAGGKAIVRRFGNVVVVAAGFTGAQKSKLDAAFAALS